MALRVERVQGSRFRVQGSGGGFAASRNSLPLEGKVPRRGG